MKIIHRVYFLIFLLLNGCATQTKIDHVPANNYEKRNLVVFFDGTHNDESSYTNVAKLHNLVTLQARQDISTTYIKGVGTGTKVIGMGLGWGIGHDVREAYLYLAENYDPSRGDQISMFGFSRGAYSSRILASLLYVAGIPADIKDLNPKERKILVKEIYSAYKSKDTIEIRRAEVIKKIAKKYDGKVKFHTTPVNIKFMGLWDTVEALGWPDLKENINEPNTRYADQLCNIQAAAHALSIDDDRARVFTPLLLTRKHLREEQCDKHQVDNKNTIEEVWFSGAHSDVGGGYKDTDISGISLNWMLSRIKASGLTILPQEAKVYANFLGKTHDPESGLFGLIYRKRNRNLVAYTQLISEAANCINNAKRKEKVADGCTSTPLSSPLKVHQSVLDRLCVKTPERFESFWYKELKYQNCLSCDENNQGLVNKDPDCKTKIKAVSDEHYQFRQVTVDDNICDYSVCWDAVGTSYQGTKACNFHHPYIAQRAKQRLNKTHLLESGDSKTIIVYADVKNDQTGLYLSADKTYHFTLELVEDWVDCHVKNTTPENGRATWNGEQSFSANVLNVIGKPFAYAPMSGYMELLGEVENQQFKLGKLANNNTGFSPKSDGELLVRVNEPRFMTQVYTNNFGVLKLTIRVE